MNYFIVYSNVKGVNIDIEITGIELAEEDYINIANAIKEKGGKQNGKERSSRGKGCTQPF